MSYFSFFRKRSVTKPASAKHSGSNKRTNQVRPNVEALEERQLLSASIVGGGTILTVSGTAQNAVITIENAQTLAGYEVVNGRVTPVYEASIGVTVTTSGVLGVPQYFPARFLESLSVSGYDGDDRIYNNT